MCRKFSAVQEHCPPEKPFAIRHSLLAAVFGSAEASLSYSPLVPRPASLVPSIVQHDADMLCDEVFLQPFPSAFKSKP